MASDAEDVNDFLKRIQEMGSKRDQEDEERNKRLEEEILQGRRERAARRAGSFALSATPVPAPLTFIPRFVSGSSHGSFAVQSARCDCWCDKKCRDRL